VLGEFENSEGIPEHRSTEIQNKRTFKTGMQFKKEEIKNLPKTTLASKVVSTFTRALTPPFYRETVDGENPST
jgi:hypothetical protein